jgi:hypothetical protein
VRFKLSMMMVGGGGVASVEDSNRFTSEKALPFLEALTFLFHLDYIYTPLISSLLSICSPRIFSDP